MPKVSVIIATCNRADTINHTIESLLRQTFRDYEFLLINNGTQKIELNIIEKLIPHTNIKIQYLVQPVKGKSHALNMGIEHAKGEIIAFTDDDVILDPHWLAELVKCFGKFQCDAVGGRVIPIYPSETPPWVKNNPHQMAGAVVIYDQGDKIRLADPKLERFIGCNWAFKRSIFTECGAFRIDLGPGTPMLGEDEEFYSRLLNHNKKLCYCPQAVVYHHLDLKRLSLKHIYHWHIALGRFIAQQKWKNKKKDFTYWNGVPRYLWKGIILDLLRLCTSVFNHLSFHNSYRNFCCKAGMIYEYQQIKKKEGKT